MPRLAVYIVAAVVLFSGACRSAEDAARDAFRDRLRQPATLTVEELRRLFAEVAPAISGRTLGIQQGAASLAPNEQQRAMVLGMLSDPSAVYDAGVRTEGAESWRGVRAGATPASSEVDAAQTVWIDIQTFVPRRFEFAYSMPGLGDYSWDLTFAR